MAMNYGSMSRDEYEYRKMKQMYYQETCSQQDAMKEPAPEKAAAKPEQPKHMDRKLLLLKGA